MVNVLILRDLDLEEVLALIGSSTDPRLKRSKQELSIRAIVALVRAYGRVAMLDHYNHYIY